MASIPIAHSEIVTLANSEINETAVAEYSLGHEAAAQEVAACWGAQLHDGAGCTPQFVPGKLHFKNKFCDNCRTCIFVPLTQVRALSEEQAACVVNKRSEGFWNHAPVSMGGGQYRILNNTAGCIGPWLALFAEQPPYIEWPATGRSNSQPRSSPSPYPHPHPHPTPTATLTLTLILTLTLTLTLTPTPNPNP